MKSSEIRSAFLSYFNSKKHKIVPSAPIVVKNDPTLMFTNAGMNQFKDIFTGVKPAEFPRIADTQKCLRVSGKHNDLEEVGHDTYHHTMFEMLGNWSFGDYFKAEAIGWAYEFLVDICKINPKNLYFTVFGGDLDDNLDWDDEAFEEWKKFAPEENILKCGKKDNFWEMGETGPCGPSSEIHIDLRSDEEKAKIPGKDLVNADHPQVVEIWNLVFIQYDRKKDGSLVQLPLKSVDTGMGFERLSMVLQGKQSTYDIDLFAQLISKIEELSNKKYGDTHETDVAFRVIVDHIRAIVFAIADGQTPSSNGAGYVIRRILRRAVRYAYEFLDFKQAFLFELMPIMVEIYSEIFPEVAQQKDFIEKVIHEEEKSFFQKLERGVQMFSDYLNKKPEIIDGDFVFELYDTFGFPPDLTELMAKEKGLSLDIEGFEKNMQVQKERSRQASKADTGDWEVFSEEPDSRFVGYDKLKIEVKILRQRKVKRKNKEAFQLILNQTPFYPEGGGQVGDRGWLISSDQKIPVIDTKKENDLIVHFVTELPKNIEQAWTAQVNVQKRELTKRNHSATHLMHAALRQVLGTHVEQRGSLVNDEYLRFDFSHFGKMTAEEIELVEQMVNEKIDQAVDLHEFRNIPIDEAKSMGAMALFGEKYGETVRVIAFDQEYSVELCGGTHVKNTSEIRLFKIIGESSSAAGIRRIEALTSRKAIDYLNEKVKILQSVADLLKNPKDILKNIQQMQENFKELEKENAGFKTAQLQQLKAELSEKVEKIGNWSVIVQAVTLTDADSLKSLSFQLRKSQVETLSILAMENKGKVLLSVVFGENLETTKEFNAKSIIKSFSSLIKGGGGGQDFYATAGGKNVEVLNDFNEKIKAVLEEVLG